MASHQNNSVMHGTKGLFNKQVVFKKRMGKDYVAGPPTKNPDRVPTDNQKIHHDNFRRCTRYAKKIVGNQPLYDIYQAGAKSGQTAINAAFQDAYHAPKILNINTEFYLGQAGNPVIIQATDNFKVSKLTVSILNSTNELIETGEAVDGLDGLNWEYVTSQPNEAIAGTKITVKAVDLAGNSASMDIVL